MIVLRLFSLSLITLALMLLGADAVSSLEAGGDVRLRSIEAVWAMIDMASVAGFKTWLDATLPAPAPGVVGALLSIPAWALIGAAGVLTAFLFRQRDAD